MRPQVPYVFVTAWPSKWASGGLSGLQPPHLQSTNSSPGRRTCWSPFCASCTSCPILSPCLNELYCTPPPLPDRNEWNLQQKQQLAGGPVSVPPRRAPHAPHLPPFSLLCREAQHSTLHSQTLIRSGRCVVAGGDNDCHKRGSRISAAGCVLGGGLMGQPD